MGDWNDMICVFCLQSYSFVRAVEGMLFTIFKILQVFTRGFALAGGEEELRCEWPEPGATSQAGQSFDRRTKET